MDKRYFYKTKEDSSLGKRLLLYMKEVERVCNEAEILMKKVGADNAVPDMSSEAGGITAFMFNKTILPKEIWLYEEENGERFYYPNVRMDYMVLPESMTSPGKTTEGYIKGKLLSRRVTEEKKRSFAEIRHLLSFQQAAKFANVKVRHDNAPSIILQKERSPLFDEAAQDIKRVETALRKTVFYTITTLTGHRTAVDIQQGMFRLPVIPAFTLSDMLQMECRTEKSTVPSLFRYRGDFYIASSLPSPHPELEGIEEKVYSRIAGRFRKSV